YSLLTHLVLYGSVHHRDLPSFPTRRSSDLLRHDTLMTGRERGLIEGARRGFRGGDEPWDLQRRRHGLAERLEALARRAVRDAQRIESQAVEEESLDRQLGAQLFDVELAAEATHGDLERMRPTRGIERDRLTIEHQRPAGERTRHGDDLRQGAGDIVQRARIDAHLIGPLVYLYARPVHLPLERHLALELRECLAHVGSGLGEHGGDRREQLQLESAQGIGAFAQCRSGNRSQTL